MQSLPICYTLISVCVRDFPLVLAETPPAPSPTPSPTPTSTCFYGAWGACSVTTTCGMYSQIMPASCQIEGVAVSSSLCPECTPGIQPCSGTTAGQRTDPPNPKSLDHMLPHSSTGELGTLGNAVRHVTRQHHMLRLINMAARGTRLAAQYRCCEHGASGRNGCCAGRVSLGTSVGGSPIGLDSARAFGSEPTFWLVQCVPRTAGTRGTRSLLLLEAAIARQLEGFSMRASAVSRLPH